MINNNLYFLPTGGQVVSQNGGELAIGVGTANSLLAPGAASNGWTMLTDVVANSLLAGAYTVGASTTIPQTVRSYTTAPSAEVMLAATFKAASSGPTPSPAATATRDADPSGDPDANPSDDPDANPNSHHKSNQLQPRPQRQRPTPHPTLTPKGKSTPNRKRSSATGFRRGRVAVLAKQ